MAGFRVDAKHDDVVRFLVLRKKKLAGRIDPETARDLPCVGVYSIGVSVPLLESIAKTAMVSLPRFEA
jgi:hypothetical protein